MAGGSASVLLAAIETHYDELTGYVRRKVRCPALAADIVQETCVRLASTSTPADVKNPRAFLYRVAGNLVVDHQRRERTRSRYLADGAPSDHVADARPSAERALDSRQRLDRLLRAADALPPRCREVFVLRKFDGVDQAEIAARLGISRNMVEKHLRRALLHLAARLDEGD